MPTTLGHTAGASAGPAGASRAGKYVQRFELPIADHQDVELLVEGDYLTFRGVP